MNILHPPRFTTKLFFVFVSLCLLLSNFGQAPATIVKASTDLLSSPTDVSATPCTITFTGVPPFGATPPFKAESHRTLYGRVDCIDGRDLKDFRIAVYIYTSEDIYQENKGWWTKHTFVDSLTVIKFNKTNGKWEWKTTVYTCCIDHLATKYAAFLVPKDINKKEIAAGGNPELPAVLFNYPYLIEDRAPLSPPTLVSPVNAESLLTLGPSFDWDDVTDGSGYNVQIAKDSAFKQTILNAYIADSAYTSTIDLPKDSTLYWRVRALIGDAYRNWSATRSFITPPSPPTIPLLSLPKNKALTTDYTPELVWKPVKVTTGIFFDHYQIQVDDDNDFSSPVIDDSSVTDQFTPKFIPSSDLSPNTTYYWRVRAFNTLGEFSAWSKVYYFRTAITPPNLLTPSNGNPVGTLQPSFDWDDVPGATGYTIQVARDSAFKKSVLKANTVSSVYTAIKNLPSGTTLYWRVQAKGPNGPSLWSVTFSFVTP